jgi:DNA processing protein
LRTIPGITAAAATALAATTLEGGQLAIERTERLGGRVLVPSDPEYPDHLRPIVEPPPVLFALGNLDFLRRPAAAIVEPEPHAIWWEVARR